MKNLIKPNIRHQMFYSEDDYQYEIDNIIEYLENDLGQYLVLYEVDRNKTNINSVYKETVTSENGIRFKAPREFPCQYNIDDSTLKNIDNKTANQVYSLQGNLTINVIKEILEKYKCDIKRGDYIGVPVDYNKMIYYTVVDDGKVNYSNKNYLGAWRPTWRVITCAPATEFESHSSI